jgi:hypothetical protein
LLGPASEFLSGIVKGEEEEEEEEKVKGSV